jgi:hypothetical protein
MTSRQRLKRLVPPSPRRPKPPRQPDPGESLIQERLTPLVETLVHPDESCRRAVVEHVLRTCIPALVARLIERLMERCQFFPRWLIGCQVPRSFCHFLRG